MANIFRLLTRRDWAAIIGYSLLTLVVYQKAWWRGELFFGGDLALYHGPCLNYISQRLRQGELPHWNPYLYAGTPFIVSPQTGVFYPPNWIGLVRRADQAVTVLGIAHLVLAAGLMYAFCRLALGLGPLASFLGGATFSCAGNLPAHFEHTAVLMSGSWLPGILLTCHLGLATRRPIWYALAGAMLGLAILAGGVQFVYLTCCAITLLFLFNSWWPITRTEQTGHDRELTAIQPGGSATERGAWLRFRTCMIALCIVAMVAAGVGCAQLLPTVTFIPSSPRSGGMDIASAGAGSMPPLYAFILSICPHFFGHQGNAYWGAGSQQELSLYLALIPLSLIPLGLLNAPRRRAVVFLGLLAGISLLLSFGHYTPLFGLAHTILPGLAYFRVPARFLFLFSFAGAALGAVGLEELLRTSRQRRAILVTSLTVFWVAIGVWGFGAARQTGNVERLAPLGDNESKLGRVWTRFQLLRLSRATGGLHEYYWRLYLQTVAMGGVSVAAILVAGLRPKWGGPVLATLLCLDLVGFSRGLSPWAQAGEGNHLMHAPAWITELKEHLRNYRCALPEALFHPNLGILHSLPVMDGYDPFLPQARHTALVNAGDPQDFYFARRLAQLFAMAYEARLDPSIDVRQLSPRAAREVINVSRNADVPPRARLIDKAEIVADGPAALARVLANDFDPWRTLVIEEPPAPGTAKNHASDTGQTGQESGVDGESRVASQEGTDKRTDLEDARWTADEPERLALEVETARPAWLLVSDAYWPAWKAYVNGQQIPIRRANYYFRAVPVPAGHSVIEMRYIDRSIWLGVTVSLLTSAGIVTVVVAQNWVRRGR